jgi:photosystem II stability/assembly factor-like uncharacterized protein
VRIIEMPFLLIQLCILPFLLLSDLNAQVGDPTGRHMYVSFYYAPPPTNVSRAAPVYQGLAVSSDRGETWQNRGWMTSAVSGLVVAHDDPDRILLATDYGVLSTADAGKQWKLSSGPDMPPTLDVARVKNTIWAATVGGLYQSADEGAQWRVRNVGLTQPNSMYVTSILLLEESMLISTGNGVYRSTDDGNSWFQSGLEGNSLLGIVAHPRFPSHLAAYSQQSGIWVSTDGGRSWTARNEGLQSIFVKCVAFDPSDRFTLVIGTQLIGVLRSSDMGKTWEQSSGGLMNFNITALFFDLDHPDRIYAGAENGSFVSLNRGKSWQPFSIRLGYVSDIWMQ